MRTARRSVPAWGWASNGSPVHVAQQVGAGDSARWSGCELHSASCFPQRSPAVVAVIFKRMRESVRTE